MPTPSGHTRAIRATRVTGTAVYNRDGDKIGEVEDVMLDKMSNEILFAVVGFGGILGMGQKYHPLPWAMLDYEDDKNGYVTNVTKEQLEKAPSDSIENLTKDDGNQWKQQTYAHYGVQPGQSA
ncbi:MAG: PRC-barrel domain-containing protein [Pseudomonadota bacterium]